MNGGFEQGFEIIKTQIGKFFCNLSIFRNLHPDELITVAVLAGFGFEEPFIDALVFSGGVLSEFFLRRDHVRRLTPLPKSANPVTLIKK